MNIHQDVTVTGKTKNFSTFSVVHPKTQNPSGAPEDKNPNSQTLPNKKLQNNPSLLEPPKKKTNLQDNIKKLKEARQ